MQQDKLIAKYNTAGPRYTSYPTVVYWEEDKFTTQGWLDSIQQNESHYENPEISLYIHLPYCESLCTFCGCNKRITKNHEVERPYIDTLLNEWGLYLSQLSRKPRIKEIHLGGGTPTFFSVTKLSKLIEGLLLHAEIVPGAEFSFEGHPNSTHKEHLLTLYNLGFRRVSYGIQCFDPTVQKAIHRIQSYEQVEKITQLSRAIGYTSVNYDVIYGLPHQSLSSIEDTMQKVIGLKPDRIAYYSYAHVPWVKGNGQRAFSEKDLPQGKEKLALYEKGKAMLLTAGYHEIGMDHFALPEDNLYAASQQGRLHRNFMGYTAAPSQLMIGLGVSAISDSWFGFAQNEKTVEEYIQRVDEGELPVFRGHILTKEDLIVRQHILDIMCRFETRYPKNKVRYQEILNRLAPFLDDDLIRLDDARITVTEKGRPFIRNICMAFDLRLWTSKPKTQIFSMTI